MAHKLGFVQEYTAKLGALQAKGDDYDIAAASDRRGGVLSHELGHGTISGTRGTGVI